MNEDFGGDFITLIDDDGNEVEMELLDTLELDDQMYMAFAPADADEADEEIEIVILKVQEENGDEILVSVDDDAELDRVYELFMERIETEESDDSDENEGD
jgi:uncharacterized protein YrzB (UPF0473 family)